MKQLTQHSLDNLLQQLAPLIVDVPSVVISAGPCEVNNGGCEYICLPHATVLCACPLGFTLGSDNKSCHSDTLHDNFFLLFDDIHGAVYQASDTSGSKEVLAVDIGGEQAPVAVAYDNSLDLMVWLTKGPTVYLRTRKIATGAETSILFSE